VFSREVSSPPGVVFLLSLLFRRETVSQIPGASAPVELVELQGNH